VADSKWGGGRGRWPSPLLALIFFLQKATFFRIKANSLSCAFAINEDGADKLSSPFFEIFGSATDYSNYTVSF